MRDLLYLERVEEAETLLKPRRIEVLRQLAEPRSCTEVAARLDQTQQRVYYHVKRLVEHGLVTQVAERRVRGINEGVYQATARAYWLSPRLVGRIGQRQQRDEAKVPGATPASRTRTSRTCRRSASRARSGCDRTGAPSLWPT